MDNLYLASAFIYWKCNVTLQQCKSLGRKHSLIYLVNRIWLRKHHVPSVVQYEDIRFC